MWFKCIGIQGNGDGWTDKDFHTAFAIFDLEFDFLITKDADDTVSKRGRRYCHNRKWSERIVKSESVIDHVRKNGGIIMFFCEEVPEEISECAMMGIPVIVFGPDFVGTLEEVWSE